MGLFDRDKRTGGFMDEIRCDEPSYLIWKWHPAGVQLGEGNRENAMGFVSEGKGWRSSCFCLQAKERHYAGLH